MLSLASFMYILYGKGHFIGLLIEYWTLIGCHRHVSARDERDYEWTNYNQLNHITGPEGHY